MKKKELDVASICLQSLLQSPRQRGGGELYICQILLRSITMEANLRRSTSAVDFIFEKRIHCDLGFGT